jgi:hypothetical protein
VLIQPPTPVRSFVNSHTQFTKYSSVPSKSLLQPPKLAPSAWQLYFTDWIARHQATNTRKLNVAQAAKEAGQEYALLTDSQKEVLLTLSCLTLHSSLILSSAAVQTTFSGAQGGS